MKIKLICQVKNGFEYLPAFLAYHEHLFDEIHIIDQCSDLDLRGLNSKSQNIFFYTTSYSFFNAMVGTNAILEFKNIRQTSDFTFVLDIDEFLPFNIRSDLEHFLQQHRDNDAIQFQWRNGLNFSHSETANDVLDSKSDLRFFNTPSRVMKLAYNARKTRWFLPYHGNHYAKFHFVKFAGLRKKPKISKSNLPIFHIPFSSINNLRDKIQNFDEHEFFEKMINQHDATREMFQRIEDKTITLDDLCFFVANYRTLDRGNKEHIDKRQVIASSKHDFQAVNLFSPLQNRISFWSLKLKDCERSKNHPEPAEHAEKVKHIMGKGIYRYFFYQNVKSNLYIDTENTIRFR